MDDLYKLDLYPISIIILNRNLPRDNPMHRVSSSIAWNIEVQYYPG